MNLSDPQITAGIIATGGVVIVAAVTTAANYAMDARRERREALRDAATARHQSRSQSFAHRREALVDFAQSVSSWATRIEYEKTMGEWTGADFSTFSRLEPKLELVRVYGTPGVRTHAESLFQALVDYGYSTSRGEQQAWDALQASLEAFRAAVRADLDL